MRDGAEQSLDLSALEAWFQGEIVRPHERSRRAASSATSAPGAPARSAREIILPGRHLAPDERVAIYSRMYFSRLLECMTADYPSVLALCGEPAFERLVRAYLARHPSRHYSLNVLGRHLPEFLNEPIKIARRALLADVARLERSMSDVFDAHAGAPLETSALARLGGADWERVHLVLSPALEIHTFAHRANAVVTATRQGATMPPLGRSATWTAVYRKDFVVWRMDLTQPMHAILHVLQEGQSLRAAIELCARRSTGTVEDLQARMFQWFGEWVGEGFFAGIEIR